MEEVDLKGVFPSRREEMRRRVALIRDYLAIARPGLVDDQRLADELGLGIQAALRLVAAWRQHGRASAVPGARHAFRQPNRLNPRIPFEVEDVIDEVISDLGLQAIAADIIRMVEERCDRLGLTPAGEQAITARLLRRRHEGAPAAAAPAALVIDHTAVSLPVLDQTGTRRLPILTFAALMPTGHVLAHELSVTRPNPQGAARVLLGTLVAATSGAKVPLEIAADFTSGWKELLDALAAAGIDRRGRSAAPVPSMGAAGLVFGDAVGEVRIRPRHTHRPAAIGATTREGRAKPFSLADATSAIDDAMAMHNDGRSFGSFHLATAKRMPTLTKRLEALANSPAEAPRHRRPTRFI